ncbi:MAG: histidine phosphatase family protein [Chitinophagaceae bacterium]
MRVFLLRHGETFWNADGNRYCGRTDIGLTEKGMAQAHMVKTQLARTDLAAVYSSPLQRARITAEIASGKDVLTDDRIIEADFGQWEGKTKEEFLAEIPDSWTKWMADPFQHRAGYTGETGAEIVSRVDAFFQQLLQAHQNQTVLVVAHNGVNRLYMAHKLGMPLSNYRQLVQHNSSITCFELDEKGTLTLEYLNAKI